MTRVRRLMLVSSIGMLAAACGSDDESSDTTAAVVTTPTTEAAGTTEASATTNAPTESAPSTEETVPVTGETVPVTEETVPVTEATDPIETEPTGEPLVVGILTDRSGHQKADFGAGAEVAEAWESYVNESGGVGNRPVDVKVYDTKGTGPDGLAAAQAAVADGIDVAVVFSAGADNVMNPYLNEQGVPIVGAIGYSPVAWRDLPNTFITFTDPLVAAAAFADGAAEVGATRMGVVLCNETEACAAAAPLMEARAEELGIEWGGVAQSSSSQPSYTAECLSLIEAGVDYIAGGINAAANARLFRDCSLQGYEGYFGVALSSVTGANIRPSEVNIGGAMNSVPWFLDIPAVHRYLEVMEQFRPEADVENATGTAVWAALEMIRVALDAHPPTGDGDIAPAAVTDALRQVKDEDLDGLLPAPVTFAEGADKSLPCLWTYRFADGEFTVGNGGEPVCR